MPFGLSSATEIMQHKLTNLFRDLKGIFVDIDDILVYAKNNQEHNQILSEVLRRIQDAGLKLNKNKCKFRQSEVKYQGQIFNKDGMKADPEKVDAITNLPPPKNTTQLRQFLGMINYLGRYVENLASVLKPISELLQDSMTWTWDFPQEEAFRKAKQLVSSTLVLAYYDQTKPL
jgi:hypothetical protein